VGFERSTVELLDGQRRIEVALVEEAQAARNIRSAAGPDGRNRLGDPGARNVPLR
jgi:hypothetical protein